MRAKLVDTDFEQKREGNRAGWGSRAEKEEEKGKRKKKNVMRLTDYFWLVMKGPRIKAGEVHVQRYHLGNPGIP